MAVTSGVAAMRLLAAAEEREKLAKFKAEQDVKEQAEREAAAAVAKAEHEARVMKIKSEQDAKEQAEREAAAAVAKAAHEARVMKIKSEQDAKEQAEREAAAAAAKAEEVMHRIPAMVRCLSGHLTVTTVRIIGATGTKADSVNGEYEATTELSDALPVYAKVGDRNMWLEYRASSMEWQVKATAYKGKDTCTAKCVVPAKCLPQACPAGQWRVVDGFFVHQPAVSVVTLPEVETYRAEMAREAARVVQGNQHVSISGATGPAAGRINGMYKPTEEMCGNVTVYVKLDDGSKCLEYNASRKQWQVKPSGSKGTDDFSMLCPVPVKCLPQDCPAGKWEVADGTDFNPQPAVTITVVTREEIGAYLAEMERAVEAYRAEVEREAAVVVKGRHNVRITGATGTRAGDINGIYEPTEEMSGNATVYVKVNDHDKWLEYRAVSKRWGVKRTIDKGTDGCTAYCEVFAKCLPQDGPAGTWEVADGSKFKTQRAVTISVITQEEVEAYLADAARVLNGNQHVHIAGAIGPKADDINGMYKPTEEMCGNVTVYSKLGDHFKSLGYSGSDIPREDGEMWLEYRSKEWQVKSTKHKGTSLCSAFCGVPIKCLPQECPAGQWQVVVDGNSVPQPAVIISICVRIAGAMGDMASGINGIYEPTSRLSAGMPVYYKYYKTGAKLCLEYNASLTRWQMKDSYSIGTDHCYAYCIVPVKCLPQLCPAGQWRVVDGTKFTPQPAVTIAVITQQEEQAYMKGKAKGDDCVVM